MKTMKVIEKNPGRKIEYEENKTRLTLGDDELMLNLSRYQRDWPVKIDICMNRDRMLVVGTGDGLYYAAQVEVPPFEYAEALEGDDEAGSNNEPLPLDMKKVTLTLWAVDKLTHSHIAGEATAEGGHTDA